MGGWLRKQNQARPSINPSIESNHLFHHFDITLPSLSIRPSPTYHHLLLISSYLSGSYRFARITLLFVSPPDHWSGNKNNRSTLEKSFLASPLPLALPSLLASHPHLILPLRTADPLWSSRTSLPYKLDATEGGVTSLSIRWN